MVAWWRAQAGFGEDFAGHILAAGNPCIGDDELLVRASAVLKSQGPENWPRVLVLL